MKVESEDERKQPTNGLPRRLHAFHVARDRDLIRLFAARVGPIRVREVNVAARLLHDFLDVVAAFADDVAVVCKTDVHFQSRSLGFRVQFGNDFLFRPLNEVAFP